MDLRVRPLSNLRGLSMPYRRAAICSDSSTSFAASARQEQVQIDTL